MCTTVHVYSYLVRLPAGILCTNREGAVGEVGLGHNLLHLVHGGNPFRWGAEQFVGQLDRGELEILECYLEHVWG